MAWELEEAVQYYQKQGAPSDQTALVNLLREIQQEHGGSIPQCLLQPLAEQLGAKESYLLAVIRRIPSLRMGQQHTLQLCGGPNCGKHTQLAAYAAELQRRSGGKLQVRFGPCMRMCGKGPNIKFDGKLYNKATKEMLDALMQNAAL